MGCWNTGKRENRKAKGRAQRGFIKKEWEGCWVRDKGTPGRQKRNNTPTVIKKKRERESRRLLECGEREGERRQGDIRLEEGK